MAYDEAMAHAPTGIDCGSTGVCVPMSCYQDVSLAVDHNDTAHEWAVRVCAEVDPPRGDARWAFANVNIDPEPAYADDTLTCAYSFTDADGDADASGTIKDFNADFVQLQLELRHQVLESDVSRRPHRRRGAAAPLHEAKRRCDSSGHREPAGPPPHSRCSD